MLNALSAKPNALGWSGAALLHRCHLTHPRREPPPRPHGCSVFTAVISSTAAILPAAARSSPSFPCSTAPKPHPDVGLTLAGDRRASPGSTCARAGGRCPPHHRAPHSCSPQPRTDPCLVRQRITQVFKRKPL